MITVAWPSGFLAYRLATGARLCGDPNETAWERGMLASVGQQIGGHAWDPKRRRVQMRVVPNFPLRVSARRRTDYAYYLACNPDWNQGYTAIAYHRLLPGVLDWTRVLVNILWARLNRFCRLRHIGC